MQASILQNKQTKADLLQLHMSVCVWAVFYLSVTLFWIKSGTLNELNMQVRTCCILILYKGIKKQIPLIFI